MVVYKLRRSNKFLRFGGWQEVRRHCNDVSIRNRLWQALSDVRCVKVFLVDFTVAVIGQSCGGLQMIHRDLKTPNIMLDESGVVKVTDFGLSVLHTTTNEAEMTGETGTYRWMAPEVIRHLPYGTKSDVFSYGVVLWEILTHRMPWENLTPVQVCALDVIQYTCEILEVVFVHLWRVSER